MRFSIKNGCKCCQDQLANAKNQTHFTLSGCACEEGAWVGDSVVRVGTLVGDHVKGDCETIVDAGHWYGCDADPHGCCILQASNSLSSRSNALGPVKLELKCT